MVRPTFYQAMTRDRTDAEPLKRTNHLQGTDVNTHQARESGSHTKAALHQSCQQAPGLPITIRERASGGTRRKVRERPGEPDGK
jgi:hypothetical protein